MALVRGTPALVLGSQDWFNRNLFKTRLEQACRLLAVSL